MPATMLSAARQLTQRRPGTVTAVSRRSVTVRAAYVSRADFKAAVVTGGAAPLFGLFLNSSSPQIAEQLAAAGDFDWLLVDAQHSPVGVNRLQAMLLALAAHGCPALVRVQGPGDRAGIQQALDLGAYGIVVPTVRTAADARAAVDAAHFPPLGSRSFGAPISPQLGRPVPEFLAAARGEVLVALQVETAEALDNLEDILAVPGVDATFNGPFDLSYALGLFERHGFPGGLESEELRAASRRVVDCCRAAGVAPGSFAGGLEGAGKLVEEGYRLISCATDVSLLGGAAAQHGAALRGLAGSR